MRERHMTLEQTIQLYPRIRTADKLESKERETYIAGGLYALLSGCPPPSSPPSGGGRGSGFARLKIYDLPSVNAQLHLHSSEDGNTIPEGNLVANENPEEIRRTLNGYESAMAEYYFKQFGIEPIIKDKKK